MSPFLLDLPAAGVDTPSRVHWHGTRVLHDRAAQGLERDLMIACLRLSQALESRAGSGILLTTDIDESLTLTGEFSVDEPSAFDFDYPRTAEGYVTMQLRPASVPDLDWDF
jgi:hypothetical protein